MTAKKAFDFDDYKEYLRYMEHSRAHLQRGFRSRLAEETGCQNPFITQVLNSNANFSLEQGLRISKYLGHSEEEKKYFVLLIELGRAGTEELKSYFKSQLLELKDVYLNIKDRVGHDFVLNAETRAQYFSQWYFAAIHVLVTIPKFRSVESISKALNMQAETVQQAALFLIPCGLLSEQ